MKITVEQFKQKINRQIRALDNDKILRTAVVAVNEKRIERIFEKGLNSAGVQIGSYNSTKPIYVSSSQAPRKVNGKGKTGKPIKSGYYASYKAFRADMGRESGFVNLRLTNELQNDVASANLSKGSTGIAPFKPTKVNQTTYQVSLKKPINIQKVRGLTKKYGEFLKHTKEEVDLFNSVLRKEVQLALAK